MKYALFTSNDHTRGGWHNFVDYFKTPKQAMTAARKLNPSWFHVVNIAKGKIVAIRTAPQRTTR